MSKDKINNSIEIVNRKAKFLYSFVQLFEAGMQLTGTEIKSIRQGNVSMRDAYCQVRNGEVFVRNLHISEYSFGEQNHDPLRVRKLLLKKNEIGKIARRMSEKGQTLIPYRLYLNDRGIAKLEIALATGKKSFDKRNSIKEKDQKRDLDRLTKGL